MTDSVQEDHPDAVFIHYSLGDAEKSLENHVPDSTRELSVLTSGEESPSLNDFDANLDADDESTIDDSPYPEVRSAVANFDDTSMPASTLRAWVLGICGAIILPGLNQFFYFRYPSVAIGNLVAQVIFFPLGRAWACTLPQNKIFGISLNPGPFTIKEHVLVTVMASVGANSAYATDIVAVQRVFYSTTWNLSYQWMLVISTQLIGFSIGGIARRLLVAPPSMIWPSTLVSCALFNTLHSQNYAGVGSYEGISRERFFLFAFTAAIIWYFIPGYVFQALSLFSWVCWIAPRNIKINQIFGFHSGLGFGVLTFDWNQIAFIGSPLATPFWAEANVIFGFLFFYWFLTPILYYSNAWNSYYMPITSPSAFDNKGNIYNVSRILTSETRINVTAYEAYSPLFLSTTFAMSYGLSFMSITATISHTILYFGKPIRLHFKRSLREQQDIHARLMSRYPQVPEWWYACIFVSMFTFACICMKLWPTDMTIWALVVALVIASVYIIPIGMIQAVTNRQIGLNVITELIIGYMLPGRPVAMMMFKTFGYITMSQAMQFTADFKLGHYMKVPPRPMFWCQIVATVIAGTVQLGVQAWLFDNIPDMCDPYQEDNFTCASTRVFGTASIIWGVIGPERQFNKGQVYHALLFFFLIGALCPVILWLTARRYPNTFLSYLNFPLVFAGVQLIPPATSINYVPWAVVGFTFQYVIRRRYFPFWAKYNYVLSAALDAGTAVGVLMVYFCLQYPLHGKIGKHTIQVWWGNTVFKHTADWHNVPLKSLSEGMTFGPTTW